MNEEPIMQAPVMDGPIEDIDEFAKCFRILSNPVRLQIYLAILEKSCECDVSVKDGMGGNCVTQIASELGIPQPSVSNHVKELVNCGLVKTQRRGRKVFLFGSDVMVDDLEKFTEYMRERITVMSGGAS